MLTYIIMPPKRTFSGTREGGTALIHTFESIKRGKEKTAQVLNTRYKQNYLLDYPDATDDEIQTAMKNHITWLGGKQLGSTITEVLKNFDGAKQAVIRRVEMKANEPTRILERTKVIDKAEEDKDRIIKEADDDLAKKGDQILKIVKRKPRTDEERDRQQQLVSELELKNLPKQQFKKADNAFKKLQDSKVKKQVDRAQKQQYEKDIRDWEAQPVQTRGALPPVPPPGIFPIQQKDLEEDHKEENQLKKITRRNVAKIDDKLPKVEQSTTVKPTIDASDIRQALAKSNNRRFKIGTNVITYHRLNGIGKTATQFL